MTAQYKRKKIRSSNAMLVKRLARFALFALLILMIPFSAIFLIRSNNPNRFTGIVESEGETIGSVEPSRIVAITVSAGQSVESGDVLVRLEPTERTMDIAVNEARLLDYEHTLLRYRENQLQYLQAIEENIRKYCQLIAEAAVELEQEKMNRVRDQAELAGLHKELTHLQTLIKKGVVSEIELADIRPRITTLELTIKQYKPLIEALQQRLDSAQQGYNEVSSQKQTFQQNQTYAHYEASLKKAREAYAKITVGEPTVLRASRAGVVSRIQHQAGDVVAAGDPIIRIAARSSMYIIAMLPQGTHELLSAGDLLQVNRITTQPSNNAPLLAEVENLDPEVMDLIDPFNPTPRMPLRGRRVRLRIMTQTHNLMPGETVYLHSAENFTLFDELKRCFMPRSGIKQQILFTQSR
jgi:multidrug resistance efflux pump